MVEKSLNLKSRETYRLASLLAQLTGENMTQAVTVALQERLRRIQQSEPKVSLAEELMAIGSDCASRLSKRTRKLDHGVLLYDRKGLPR